MAEVKLNALANPTVIATAVVYGFLLRVAWVAGWAESSLDTSSAPRLTISRAVSVLPLGSPGSESS